MSIVKAYIHVLLVVTDTDQAVMVRDVSGRGTCDCICVCGQPPDFPENMVFGDACQCDTFSCLRPGDQQVCSGMCV